ncbi:hypothetical protein [Methylibium petroleiphilum]|uniref:Transmembrane protein n=1 Tax=Methylibium petroleiphilum (strain ATCC BAA-1232 / LMG 22953 / PM1) TaxID=420662 RepID=A2SML7_METPP|nr:hypothetical protein [Methylibium petroleiphilum]ABM96806.1 hypothetical protein Mpe_B0025 [Methylibium petroleiphilum PM1]
MTTISDLDTDKLAFFEAKYKSFTDDQLAEVAQRIHELADEAAEAVRRAFASRGRVFPGPVATGGETTKELTEGERAEQTKLSMELWNSRLSRRVQNLFWVQALMFSGALLGPGSGLKLGVLPFLLVSGALVWAANKAGRNYTRNVCRVADKSIGEKREALSNASIILWVLVVPSTLLGVMLASWFRA